MLFLYPNIGTKHLNGCFFFIHKLAIRDFLDKDIYFHCYKKCSARSDATNITKPNKGENEIHRPANFNYLAKFQKPTDAINVIVPVDFFYYLSIRDLSNYKIEILCLLFSILKEIRPSGIFFIKDLFLLFC